MSSVINIRVQGRVYSLRTHESEDQIRKVVAYVEERLAEMAGNRSVDTVDLMILSLLNIAGEHLHLLEQIKQQDIDQDAVVEPRVAAVRCEIEP